jgi:hypothetical protein
MTTIIGENKKTELELCAEEINQTCDKYKMKLIPILRSNELGIYPDLILKKNEPTGETKKTA